MASTEEPILSRIDRLDNMLEQLEEIRGYNRSPKSSCASTPSSGTLTSDGRVSSVDFSPKSLEKHCRRIDHVIMETEVRGTLIERLNHLEDRMLKIEVEWKERRKKEETKTITEKKEKEKEKDSPKKKGLKQLVKQCGKARGSHKDTTVYLYHVILFFESFSSSSSFPFFLVVQKLFFLFGEVGTLVFTSHDDEQLFVVKN